VIRQPAGQAVHADAIRASSRRRVFVCICHEAHARVIAKSRVFPGGRIEGDLRVLACFGGSTEVRDDEGAGGVPTKVVRRKAEPQCTFCLEHLECTRISYPVLARCDEQRKVERGRGHHVWAARFGGQGRFVGLDGTLSVVQSQQRPGSIDMSLRRIKTIPQGEKLIQQPQRHPRMALGESVGLDSRGLPLVPSAAELGKEGCFDAAVPIRIPEPIVTPHFRPRAPPESLFERNLPELPPGLFGQRLLPVVSVSG
jgi:hypothetical protein